MTRLPLLLIGLTSLVSASFGTPYEQVLQTQKMVEERVNALVRLYDPQGFSIVTIKLKMEAEPLPGSPFLFEDYTLPGDDRIDIESIDARLITRLETMPDDAVSLVRESLLPFAATIRVSVKQVQPPKIETTIPEMRISYPEGKSWLSPLLSTLSGQALLGAFFLLVFTAVIALWRLGQGMERGAGNLAGSLTQGLGALKDSLQDGGLGGGSSETAMTFASSGTSSSNSGSAILTMSNESCLSLLSDCYWCGKDEYAAFLWEQFGIAQRLSVIAAWPALERYVRNFQSVTPRDLGLHTDVNYLNPLPFFRQNNAALTEIARKAPALLSKLSPLRSETLLLGVQERLDLQAKSGSGDAIPDFKTMAPSPERSLRAFSKIRLSTESGENEAIALRELPVEAKEQFITLAWMVQLPKEKVSGILESFTARDLALAWVGPAPLLAYLSDCVSPKKKDLVESYRKTVVPSRDSEAFHRLHRLSMDAFRQMRAAVDQGDDHAQAA